MGGEFLNDAWEEFMEDLEKQDREDNESNQPDTDPYDDPTDDDNDSDSPSDPYQQAKDLFRNSNMSDADWQALEKMLNDITKDCLGKALYNELVKKVTNNGAQPHLRLHFEFYTPANDRERGQFNYTNSEMKINAELKNQSNVLFHEMWHALQAYSEDVPSYASSLINQEYEARYAQYLYLKDIPDIQFQDILWEATYSDSQIGLALSELEKRIDENGNLIVSAENLSRYLYDVVKPELATLGYNETNGYTFDPGRSATDNFKNLKTLANKKDC